MATLQTTVTNLDTWFKRQINRLLENRWLDLGLRGKMGLQVTIGMLGLMTIFGLLAVSSARQATQQALNERSMLTRMSAESLDTILLHIVDDLKILVQQPALADAQTSQIEQELSLRPIQIFHKPVFLFNHHGELEARSTTGTPYIPWEDSTISQSG
jgi:hypothetical protein